MDALEGTSIFAVESFSFVKRGNLPYPQILLSENSGGCYFALLENLVGRGNEQVKEAIGFAQRQKRSPRYLVVAF